MEGTGNFEHLKKEIEKSYKEKLEEFEKSSLEEFDKEKQELKEQHEKALKKAKSELKDEEKKVFKSTLAEEMLNAKKEFENTREKLINNVFEKALNKSNKVLLGTDYLKTVKKLAKGKAEILGGFEEYMKTFSDVKIDERINGVIVKKDNLIFDFTYGKFIESRRLDLRHKVSQILFEDVN
ncbi:MAG: hypothetical protein ACTSYA_01570 [Candidatus Kariarchaeaceae archaeon]